MPQLRSIWKGHIRFSLVTIPIRIYNAVDTAQSVRFNQIHRDCNGRIGYDKRCKKCEKQVTTENILKGYQYEPDQYVVFEKNDLDKLKLKSTKALDIEGFVDAGEVHPTLFDAPCYAGPDGDGKEIVAMEEEEVVDIMSALKQSIEQAKDSKKPMTKSRSKARTRTKAKAKSASQKHKTA